jgi:hypothetical protein
MARYVIFGRSGSGKSWFFGWVLERAAPKFDYAVHVDIEDEEQGLSMEGESLFKTFYVDREFADETVEYQERKMSKVEAVILHNRRVRAVPDGLTPSEQRELFATISGLAMEVGKTESTFHLSADEAHHLLPDMNPGNMDERIVRMLTGGRKKGVEWAFATQRPAKLFEDAFTQANWGVYFSLTKDNDIAKVNNSIGVNAYQTLPKLQPREYILENLDDGTVKLSSSNELDRQFPHFASDDGIADGVLEEAGEGADDLRDLDDEEIDPDEIA